MSRECGACGALWPCSKHSTPDSALVQAAWEWLEKDCPHSTKDAVLTPGTCADCLAALTDPATVERVARAIRDAFCRGIPDHGRTPCVVEVGDREAARAALAALGDVKPPATRNLP